MTELPNRRQLRSFGLLVGGIFAVIGLWPLVVRGGTPRLWTLALGIALILPALVAPGALRPLHRVWMMLAEVLGWINTRVILGAVFLLLITPMGLTMRLFRKDPLGRQFRADVETYRVPKQPRSPTHLTHQF